MNAPTLRDDFLSSILPDGVLGVAVSGGGDSMGLLHLLLRAGVSLAVATVNHNQREEAAAEADAVAVFCAGHGVPHEVLQWHWDGQGNFQDQARRGRYGLLAQWAVRAGVDAVALGHTGDDNIETFLMGLSRGAGLDGLSGMRPEFIYDGVRFCRPLLHAHRSALRDMLREAGVSWSDDPSNDDPSYHRIQVRQNMDALEAAGILPEQVLASLGNLQATRRDVNADLARAVQGRFKIDRGDLCFDAEWVGQMSPESQRRLLNCALQFVAGREYPPRGSKLGRVLADLRKKSQLHGCVIYANDGLLRVGREYGAIGGLRAPSKGLWDGRWRAGGPHSDTTEMRALGEAGLAQWGGDWRDTGLPRHAVLALPSVWDGDALCTAPLHGLSDEWHLELKQSDDAYIEFVLSH